MTRKKKLGGMKRGNKSKQKKSENENQKEKKATQKLFFLFWFETRTK